MSDLSPKKMALMLYKLSVENNAMLRMCLQDNLRANRLLQELQIFLRADRPKIDFAEIDKLMHKDLKKRELLTIELLKNSETVARLQTSEWANNAPDDLSATADAWRPMNEGDPVSGW